MKNPKPNLSKGEQKAMKEITKKKDIIIIKQRCHSPLKTKVVLHY